MSAVSPTAESWRVPALPDGLTVHVWRLALDPPAEQLERLAPVLSRDERERAHRYAFPHLRRRFTVGRGLLRFILGGYLETDPRRLVFVYGPNGKPELAPSTAAIDVRFNLSHSDEAAILAVTRGRAIGVDIETTRPIASLRGLVERYFSDRERAAFDRVPAGLQLRAFYRCWTRKEAYIKATGEGLSADLSAFDVSVEPGAPATLERVRGSVRAAQRWRLHELPCVAPQVAALCVEGHDWGAVEASPPGQPADPASSPGRSPRPTAG